jgi:hypothetical protein
MFAMAYMFARLFPHVNISLHKLREANFVVSMNKIAIK